MDWRIGTAGRNASDWAEQRMRPSGPVRRASPGAGQPAGWISLAAPPDVVQKAGAGETVGEVPQSETALTDKPARPRVDAREVAQRVYRLMLQDAVLERERGALAGRRRGE
jgi:hypothetical protein